MAWELANEPRCEGDFSGSQLQVCSQFPAITRRANSRVIGRLRICFVHINSLLAHVCVCVCVEGLLFFLWAVGHSCVSTVRTI